MGVEQQISADMRIAIATALLSKTFQVLESHHGSKLTKGDINKATGCINLFIFPFFQVKFTRHKWQISVYLEIFDLWYSGRKLEK